jgi:hypothetical protein
MDNQENPLQNSSFVLIVNPKFLAYFKLRLAVVVISDFA